MLECIDLVKKEVNKKPTTYNKSTTYNKPTTYVLVYVAIFVLIW